MHANLVLYICSSTVVSYLNGIVKIEVTDLKCNGSTGSDKFLASDIRRRTAQMLDCIRFDVRINAVFHLMTQLVLRKNPHLREMLCCTMHSHKHKHTFVLYASLSLFVQGRCVGNFG